MPYFFCLAVFAVIQLGVYLDNLDLSRVYKGYTGLPDCVE